MKDLNIRLEATEFLEENRGKVPGIGLDNDFHEATPKARATRHK